MLTQESRSFIESCSTVYERNNTGSGTDIYFSKIIAFSGIFKSNFLLNTMILSYCKVCCCTPKACAQDPHFHPATPL